jgi:hypothetical protein
MMSLDRINNIRIPNSTAEMLLIHAAEVDAWRFEIGSPRLRDQGARLAVAGLSASL